MQTRLIACVWTLSKTYIIWIYFLCTTTSFRPLQRAPFPLSEQFRPCTYQHFAWDFSFQSPSRAGNFGKGGKPNATSFFFLQKCPFLSVCPRHLAQNPFICDCHLKWLADYLHVNPIETSGARCASPRRLANKRIGQIKSKKFRCSGNFFRSPATFSSLPKKTCYSLSKERNENWRHP